MTWRKWFVRSLVLFILGALGVGVVLYQRWTNPEAVRRQVLEKLSEQFVGATVSLESARLRLLGGISLTELRLARRDDPDKTDFLYVPSAIIYHDKEQLLDGKLRIRKLELCRPRLHILRAANGSWNLADILGPVDLNEAIPTIVIKQGTIVIEDRRTTSRGPVLEIRDVNLTIINDPLPTLTFSGTGNVDVAGPLEFHGSLQRATNEAAVSLEAPSIPLSALAQRISTMDHDVGVHLCQLDGTGALQAQLCYHPGAEQPLSHDVHFQISGGKFAHARLPLPLEQIDLSLHCVNGQLSMDRGTARAGATTVSLSFKDFDAASLEERWEARFREFDLKVEHLSLTPELFAQAPEELQQLQREFLPEGLLGLTIAIRPDPAQRWRKHCVLHAEDGSAEALSFPYKLQHIIGTIDYESTSALEPMIKIDLVGQSGPRPVYIKGTVSGHRPEHSVAVDVWGDNIPLDEKLQNALPVRFRGLAQSLRPPDLARAHLPMGLGNFHSYLRRDPKQRRFLNRHVVYFHDARLCYNKFPYPLDNVSGTLDIEPEHWEFHDFRGTHLGGELRAQGQSYPGEEGDRVVIQLQGSNIPLDQKLHDALPKDLQHTWAAFSPVGQTDFLGSLSFAVRENGGESIDEEPEPAPFPEVELTLLPRDCTIKPSFFPYPLHGLNGRIYYADRWVTLEKLRARHGDSLLTLGEGYVYIKPEGGFYAEMNNVRGNPLLPDGDLTRALPGSLSKAWETFELKTPLSFGAQMIIDAPPESTRRLPVIYWDGAIALRDATLKAGVTMEHVTGTVACRGRHNGEQLEGVLGNLSLEEATVSSLANQPFRDIHSHIIVTRDAPQILRMQDLSLRYFGGEVYGPVRIEFGPTIRYDLELMASQINLEAFGRHNFGANAQLSGMATASLYLSGQGADLSQLKGTGSIDVPSGKMKELPLVLDLMKVLALRAPDRTCFDEAHINFDIQGQKVQINKLRLLGNAISLRGQGDLKLDGTDLNLDFHADWAHFPDVLPPGIKNIPPAIGDPLFKIKVRGKFGDIRCTKELVPVLVDPLKKVFGDAAPGTAKAKVGSP